MAFTDFETEQLRKALLKETRHCAVTLGMKKTSVDQLTRAVGIAKGSFYKFYESKEMLFFAVLEGIHSELYEVADRALSENIGLPQSERAAKSTLAVCRRLSDTGDMIFIENDAKLLLQRLPDEVKNVHYHDDEAHIRQLLEKYDLVPKRGASLAAATVRGLILTVSHREQKGESVFHEARGLSSPQQVDERGISDFPAAERLDGTEKRGSESIIPVNLYRMCEIGGVICHFLRTPATPWGLAEKSWLP